MAEFETPSSLYWIYHASAFGFDFQLVFVLTRKGKEANFRNMSVYLLPLLKI